MTYYSDWQWRPEYGGVVGQANATGDQPYGSAEDGPYPADHYDQAILEALADAATGSHPFTADALTSRPFLAVGIDDRLENGIYVRRYSAAAGVGAVYFTAESIGSGDWAPTLPEGATGWQYEMVQPTILSAVATFNFTVGIEDTTVSPPVVPGGEGYLEARPYLGGTWDQYGWVGPDGEPNGPLLIERSYFKTPYTDDIHTVDVLDHVDDRGRLAVTYTARSVTAPILTNPNDLDPGANTVGGVNASVEYVLTRRYRFIFPGEPPASAPPAHNRVVQRGNDGFGMTGGRRVVQARTIQSTNRALGIR